MPIEFISKIRKRKKDHARAAPSSNSPDAAPSLSTPDTTHHTPTTMPDKSNSEPKNPKGGRPTAPSDEMVPLPSQEPSLQPENQKEHRTPSPHVASGTEAQEGKKERDSTLDTHADAKLAAGSKITSRDMTVQTDPAPESASVLPWTLERHADWLWTLAYERLREQEPRALGQFEIILLGYAEDGGLVGNTGRRVSRAGLDAPVDVSARRRLMHDYLNAFLSIEKNQSADRLSDSDRDETYESRGESVIAQKVDHLRAILRKAIRSSRCVTIPWVASCLVFETIINLQSKYHQVLEGVIGTVSRMEWFIGLSNLHYDSNKDTKDLSSDATDREQGITTLVELYKAVLAYLVNVVCGFRMGSTSIQDLDFEQYDIEIRKREEHLANFSGQGLKSELKAMLALTKEFEQKRTTNGARLEDEKKQDLEVLIKRLDVPIKPIQHRVTGQARTAKHLHAWLLRTAEYQKFVSWDTDVQGRVLCITGPPGSGKTKLLQAIVQHLQMEEAAFSDGSGKVGYFFRDSTEPWDAMLLVKDLIRQILTAQPHLKSCLHDKFESTGRESFNDPHDLYAMVTLFCSLVVNPEFQHTYFVVGALEELSNRNQVAPAGTLGTKANIPLKATSQQLGVATLELIFETANISDKVRWLVSFGNHGYGAKIVSSEDFRWLSLNISSRQEQLQQDTRSFVTSKVAELQSVVHFKENIHNALQDRAEKVPIGNFMWLDMAFNTLKDCLTPWHLPKTFDDLVANAPNIKDLFERKQKIISQLEHDDRRICESILLTTAVAFEPLSAREIRSIHNIPEEVDLDILLNRMLPEFLAFHQCDDQEGRLVDFATSQAKDFIQESVRSDGLSKGHLHMASSCMQVLLNELKGKVGVPGDSSHSCINYASMYWIWHLRELEGSDLGTIDDLVGEIFDKYLFQWLDMLQANRALQRTLSMISKLKLELTNNHRTSKSFGGKYLSQGLFSLIEIHELVHESLTKDMPHGIKGELKNKILFSPTRGPVKAELLSQHFPWLTTAPITVSERAISYCLHEMTHGDSVRRCTFSADGRLLASASDESSVQLWDVQTGTSQHVLYGFDYTVKSVVMSESGPDGRSLLAASDEETVRIWELATGTELKKLKQMEKKRREASERTSDEDERNLDDNGQSGEETAGADLVEEAESGQDESDDGNSPASESPWSVSSIAITAKGDRLATSTETDLIVWTIPGFDHKTWFKSDTDGGSDHERPLRALCFSPDGRFLAASAGADILVWDTQYESLLRCLTIRSPKSQPSAPGHEIQHGESETDQDSESDDQASECRGHTDDIDGLAFSPDSKVLASGSDDTTARIWDTKTGATQAIIRYHTSHINTVSFAADNSRLATGSTDRRIAIWKRKYPDTVDEWGDGEIWTQPVQILEGHETLIWSVTFAPQGNLLASADSDGELRIWDTDMSDYENMEGSLPISEDLGHTAAVSRVTMSPDAKTIASVCMDGIVCLWDGVTGARICTMKDKHESDGLSLVFSQDGTLLVSTSMDNNAFVWTINGGSSSLKHRLEKGDTFKGHTDWVRGAAISPNNGLVATASDDKTVCVWGIQAATGPDLKKGPDPHDAIAVRVFEGHEDYVYGVAFSPDNTRLASVGDDMHVLIWNLGGDADKSVADIRMSDPTLDSPMRGVVFSVDGKTVFSTSNDGTVIAWKPDLEEEMQCQLVFRAQLRDDNDESGDGGDTSSKPRWASFGSMRIDPKDSGVLLTEFGAWPFEISEEALRETAKKREAENNKDSLLERMQPPRVSPWSISEGGERITCKEKEVISIPKAFQSWRASWVQDRCVVIGCKSGQVLLFRFSDDDRLLDFGEA